MFGFGNAKISNAIATFSLPAGHTCRFAKECLSCADRFTGRITDGKHCLFRCFSASQESTFSSVRLSRWNNLELLRANPSIEGMANLIQRSLPFGIGSVRLHVSGDFFSESYFLACLNVARNNSAVTFYGYTKALPYLIKYKQWIPRNFRFTASKGGTHDHLISKHRLIYAEVVFSTEEARRRGLEIDHDDSHAIIREKSFALLLHGTQSVGTPANEAWKVLMRQNLGNYNEKKKQLRIERPVTIYVTLKQGEIYLPQTKGLPTQRVKPPVKFVPKKRPSPRRVFGMLDL
jgi:hypothetical protein